MTVLIISFFLANMVLLGSIQRTEIINLIEQHIGRERRLNVAAQWQMEAEAK